MAHLMEHVAYMGSPKRRVLSGTGAKSNAYTDFHHTVFFASCSATNYCPPHRKKKNQVCKVLSKELLDFDNVDEDEEEEEEEEVMGDPAMSLALDALLDVMTARVDGYRLEQERAAVLSEASMINKLDYRSECLVLATLHADNSLPSRFPIGKLDQIQRWTVEDLTAFHKQHYVPNNAALFVVGDVDASRTLSLIREKFGSNDADCAHR